MASSEPSSAPTAYAGRPACLANSLPGRREELAEPDSGGVAPDIRHRLRCAEEAGGALLVTFARVDRGEAGDAPRRQPREAGGATQPQLLPEPGTLSKLVRWHG